MEMEMNSRWTRRNKSVRWWEGRERNEEGLVEPARSDL